MKKIKGIIHLTHVCIIEVEFGGHFVAKCKSKVGDITAYFRPEHVLKKDRHLIREGRIFYWIIGIKPKGQMLVFPNFGTWCKADLDKKSDAVIRFDKWMEGEGND
jgi:hypothetical protein